MVMIMIAFDDSSSVSGRFMILIHPIVKQICCVCVVLFAAVVRANLQVRASSASGSYFWQSRYLVQLQTNLLQAFSFKANLLCVRGAFYSCCEASPQRFKFVLYFKFVLQALRAVTFGRVDI